MRPTEDLYIVAENNGILIRRYNVPGNLNGMYLHVEGMHPHIVISPKLIEGSILYRATLAHELGHHFTTAGDFALVGAGETERIIGRRAERHADRWAIDFMVRTDSVRRLLHSAYSTWEIAERLCVPPDWIAKKLRWMGELN